MRILLLVSFLSLQMQGAMAQHFAVFTDYRDYFHIFDKGELREAEYLRVQSFQIGGNTIAYVDNSGTLKIYYNGNIQPFEVGSPLKYTVTDDLTAFSVYEDLRIFDHGIVNWVSSHCTAYLVEDSLVAWYDDLKHAAFVYYQGRIITLEDGLLEWPVEYMRSGDNIIAYIQSNTKSLKVFYKGETRVIKPNVENMEIRCGKDIVAYTDPATQEFKTYYKGKEFDLDIYLPRSFQTGKGIVAYVDNMGDFKVFTNGEITTVMTMTPDKYLVKDNLVIFEQQGQLKTFCNGEIKVIERYMPKNYKADLNTIAYIDENQNIKAFANCKTLGVTYEKVNKVEIYRDLIYFQSGVQTHNIIYNGKAYVY